MFYFLTTPWTLVNVETNETAVKLTAVLEQR